MRKTILAAVMAASILITGCESMPSTMQNVTQSMTTAGRDGKLDVLEMIQIGGMVMAAYKATESQKTQAEADARQVTTTQNPNNDRYIAVPVKEQKAGQKGEEQVMIWDTQQETFASDQVVVLKDKPANGQPVEVGNGVTATYIPPTSSGPADL